MLSRRVAGQRAEAQMLAQQLLSEIQSEPFTTLASTKLGTGPSGAEIAGPGRSLYNEVGDYTALIETPPKAPGGLALPGFTGWTRKVILEFIAATDPATVVGTDVGCVRITVEVYGPTTTVKPLAKAVGIRCYGWDVANGLTPSATTTVTSGTIDATPGVP